MTASFRKVPYCITCRNKQLGDDSEKNAHDTLGHKTEFYTVGGYSKPQTGAEVTAQYHETHPKFQRKNQAIKEEIDWPEEEIE
jgi:hypothetical protein